MLLLDRRPDDPITLAASREAATTGVAGYAAVTDSALGPVIVAQPLSAAPTPITLTTSPAFTDRAIAAANRSDTAGDDSTPATGLAALTLAGPSAPGDAATLGDPVKPSAGLTLPSPWSQAATDSPAGGSVSPQIVINQAALASTQPQVLDFKGTNLPVFGADTSFSFFLPSFLYQQFGVSTGVSFAGFGLNAGLSVAGGVKGGVALSLGQISPDFPVTIDPGVTPFVQDGQVFAVDPSLISTTDAQFALNLPEANASLDFGLQAQANLTFSFPGIPIGFSLPFIGFVGYTIHIPSVSIGFKSGTIFKLPSSTTIKIPGNGSVTVSELQASTVNSDPQSAYESLPTLEMSGDTAPFFSANIDLVTLLAEKVPDPFAFLAGSKMFAGGLASLSYHLFSLVVSTNLWLHEDVKLTPMSITETVTDELSGETHSGPLGSVLDFTAPGSGNGIVPLQFTFSLVVAVDTELDLDGNVELTAEGPSVGASVLGVSKTIGPLGNFNLFNLSGKLAELYSHTSYETLTSTATVDLQNFSTAVNKTISAASGAVSITQPATNLVVSSTGTVKGTAVAVNTSTLSAAMIDDSGLITASGMGIQLQAGGSVDVEATGRITGIGAATGAAIMAMKNPFDAVINDGSITGFAQGVDMLGGSVKNDTGATISAAQIGVSITNAHASVVNNGLISGAIGIDLANGGGIYNAQSGTIVASEYGVYSQGVVAIENHCTLTGGGSGVRGVAGGELMNLTNAYIHGGAAGVILDGVGDQIVGNAAGGTISGGKVGVSLTGANTTLIDYGLISGSLAAVELYGQVSNTLVLDPSASLQGQVRMDGSRVTNTISLTGAYGGVGTLTGLGEAALPFNAVVDISPGAAWNITGALDASYFRGLGAADTLTDTLITYAPGERVALNRNDDVLE
ncbi:MAG TPA: hypothetical protein VG166_00765, partial [Caulobacteraceae bacterium]|nr:hypothetical protein [Caulobacteraceae bacterium]